MKRMKRTGVLVALALSMLTARGAEVRVLDPSGKPVADVGVICLGREKGLDNTGPDGIAHVPDACRRVHCEIGDFVPAQAVIVGGKAECRLTAGVFVTAAPIPAACAAEHGCGTVLRRFDGEISESDHLLLEDPTLPAGWRPRDHFRFKVVPPGRYRFSIEVGVGPHDRWVCESDLGTLAAGEVKVAIVWRDPVRVAIRAPRPGLTVIVGRRLSGVEAPGAWQCSRLEYMEGIVTGADGTAQALVDPGRPFVIELREAGNDDPIARREFDSPPSDVVRF